MQEVSEEIKLYNNNKTMYLYGLILEPFIRLRALELVCTSEL